MGPNERSESLRLSLLGSVLNHVLILRSHNHPSVTGMSPFGVATTGG